MSVTGCQHHAPFEAHGIAEIDALAADSVDDVGLRRRPGAYPRNKVIACKPTFGTAPMRVTDAIAHHVDASVRERIPHAQEALHRKHAHRIADLQNIRMLAAVGDQLLNAPFLELRHRLGILRVDALRRNRGSEDVVDRCDPAVAVYEIGRIRAAEAGWKLRVIDHRNMQSERIEMRLIRKLLPDAVDDAVPLLHRGNHAARLGRSASDRIGCEMRESA